jgi:hypothetical protein
LESLEALEIRLPKHVNGPHIFFHDALKLRPTLSC